MSDSVDFICIETGLISILFSKSMLKIGILFENKSDIMSNPSASVETHYHWRETEEVEAVATNLKALGHDVDLIGTLDNLLERWKDNQLPEFIWNLSVRTTSRNRTALAPAILEQLGIPYTGGDATIKSLTLNKDFLKPVLQWRGISTPDWYRYGIGEKLDIPPWEKSILKPACEGYSLGLQFWETSSGLAELQNLVEQLQQQFQAAVLCEEFIQGREITVGVVGNDKPVFIGAVETLTAEGKPLEKQVLDLQAKRRGGFQKINLDLYIPQLRKLREISLDLMQLFKPLDYATFDFRVSADNQAYLLDINADATLHPQRSFAQIARNNGLSYQQLIEVILETANNKVKG
ncbi:D-alanine--D-alanine ligase A [Calothrix parasitica NIES-267]|uniref:D-alanine--D-alanine ligase A n=1 Tax=Calothrix parasitica NIES-267 TaxID=1973488 RepID=A0A1Z4M0M3_9CYAN|nr:D-alanine--D-alanine ligase A [Calothrix parasitica NIES-267]